jgi:hypothetical protein
MNPDEIYAKTELGLQELKERKLNLSIALRSLLILVDGQHTVMEILAKSRSLKVDERAMTSLERSGLIAKRYEAGRIRFETIPSRHRGRGRTLPARATDDGRGVQQYLGFRGYGLMLRLQKTANLRDLHELLPDVAIALVKRIGFDAATPIVNEMELVIRSGL